MSAIGISIVFTGLIPTEIRTLGITFAEADRKSLLLIFALVVGYFLAAFVSYALSDYLEWFAARRDLTLGRMRRDLQGERARIQEEMRARRARIREEQEERRRRTQEERRARMQEMLARARIKEEQDDEQTVKRTADKIDEMVEREEEFLERDLNQIDEMESTALANLEEYERDLAEASGVPFGFAGPIITLRFAFEFILPPIVGAVSIVALLNRAF
jgi:hypothetical protein